MNPVVDSNASEHSDGLSHEGHDVCFRNVFCI